MPSNKLTYKNLFTLVSEEIDSRQSFFNKTGFRKQLDRPASVQSFAIAAGNTRDVSSQELLAAIQTVLNGALPPRIIEGLAVTETDPVSSTVIITAGTGTVGGNLYFLEEAIEVPIPLGTTNQNSVYFINLFQDTIMVDTAQFDNKLTIAKIVVPVPGTTAYVRNKDNGSWDAYIVQYKSVNFYADDNGQFEEDSLELLKDNIGAVLADTIVGNIRLSENLRITNTQGTLQIDSQAIQIKDINETTLAKFNRNGVFFYDQHGVEMAKFSTEEARIGNLVVTANSIQSGNFVSGAQGFQILDTGNVEFNNMIVRGTIFATFGSIGGFTITPTKLYGGIIQTAAQVGTGATGVVMDTAGLRGYDAVLGLTFNLPTNGDAPTFSSGIINSTIFEINTNSVLRTSETVGDGSALSYGILINNTGLYGCGASQTLADANLKALIDGTISLTGTINASAGQIGNVTITSTGLSGGLIQGTTIRAANIETSDTVPRILINDEGLSYQTTTDVGKYGTVGVDSGAFKYGDGTHYGAGVTAFLFNVNFPILSIAAERDLADIRLFDRSDDPTSGVHQQGDFIFSEDYLKYCQTGGEPGVFVPVSGKLEARTDDPTELVDGRFWIRTDVDVIKSS